VNSIAPCAVVTFLVLLQFVQHKDQILFYLQLCFMFPVKFSLFLLQVLMSHDVSSLTLPLPWPPQVASVSLLLGIYKDCFSILQVDLSTGVYGNILSFFAQFPPSASQQR
jgi:hypothetical protein